MSIGSTLLCPSQYARLPVLCKTWHDENKAPNLRYTMYFFKWDHQFLPHYELFPRCRWLILSFSHLQFEGPALQSPVGVSIDWIARRLYWADRDCGCIEMANLDGKERIRIISTNLDHLEAIAVSPGVKWVFLIPTSIRRFCYCIILQCADWQISLQ